MNKDSSRRWTQFISVGFLMVGSFTVVNLHSAFYYQVCHIDLVIINVFIIIIFKYIQVMKL